MTLSVQNSVYQASYCSALLIGWLNFCSRVYICIAYSECLISVFLSSIDERKTEVGCPPNDIIIYNVDWSRPLWQGEYEKFSIHITAKLRNLNQKMFPFPLKSIFIRKYIKNTIPCPRGLWMHDSAPCFCVNKPDLKSIHCIFIYIAFMCFSTWLDYYKK